MGTPAAPLVKNSLNGPYRNAGNAQPNNLQQLTLFPPIRFPLALRAFFSDTPKPVVKPGLVWAAASPQHTMNLYHLALEPQAKVARAPDIPSVAWKSEIIADLQLQTGVAGVTPWLVTVAG